MTTPEEYRFEVGTAILILHNGARSCCKWQDSEVFDPIRFLKLLTSLVKHICSSVVLSQPMKTRRATEISLISGTSWVESQRARGLNLHYYFIG